MANYILTKKAVEDLSEIWNYTFDYWSENQADNYFEMLLNTCNEIANKPNQGRKYNDIVAGLFGFRAGRHIIFYQKRNIEEVLIIRILHERMDLRSRLTE
jgi:toxin ParE1/3/4